MTSGLRDARKRAAALGLNPSLATAASTARRRSSLTGNEPDSTRDTVGTDTPARRATPAMVAARCTGALMLDLSGSVANHPLLDRSAGDPRNDLALCDHESDQQR